MLSLLAQQGVAPPVLEHGSRPVAQVYLELNPQAIKLLHFSALPFSKGDGGEK